jgi:hypothetical protein
VAAGRQALRTGAAAEAEGHFARALERWHSAEAAEQLTGLDHAALLVETATAATYAGRYNRAIELARQAATELAGAGRERGRRSVVAAARPVPVHLSMG